MMKSGSGFDKIYTNFVYPMGLYIQYDILFPEYTVLSKIVFENHSYECWITSCNDIQYFISTKFDNFNSYTMDTGSIRDKTTK